MAAIPVVSLAAIIAGMFSETHASSPLRDKAPARQSPPFTDVGAPTPACGLYSLLACLSAVGIDADPATIWSTRYVGSPTGSSARELISAAERCGATATLYTHLDHRESGPRGG